jgi:hypothetical protein
MLLIFSTYLYNQQLVIKLFLLTRLNFYGRVFTRNIKKNRAKKSEAKKEETKGEEIKVLPVEGKEEDKTLPEEKKSEETEIESNWFDKEDSFDQLGLKEDLLRGIYGYGFTKPSPIQQKGILPLLKKRDTIAQVLHGSNNKL